MGQACGTVADAFALLGRFTRLAIDVALEEEANGQRLHPRAPPRQVRSWLVDMRKHPNDFPELAEFLRTGARCSSSRRLTGGGASFVKAIHVTHKAPAYRDEYERVLGVPVVFEKQ